jgi:Xaa-Pro dipeptidase
VRPWKEDESPFDLLASALRDRAAAAGPLAVEPTTRFFIIDGLTRAWSTGPSVVSGDDLVRACRIVKSPTELALMQAANDITLAALKHVHARIEVSMRGHDIMEMMVAATEALGGSHEFSLVLLNDASAYPHGSAKPQTVRKGSVVLIDSGCSVHGTSRTYPEPGYSANPRRVRRMFGTPVKRGQEIALETAKIGVAAGAIDKAVREFYEGRGWSKDYGLPGTSHRTGTASAWTGMNLPTWCAAIPHHSKPVCASPTSRESISRNNSGFGWRTAGTCQKLAQSSSRRWLLRSMNQSDVG